MIKSILFHLRDNFDKEVKTKQSQRGRRSYGYSQRPKKPDAAVYIPPSRKEAANTGTVGEGCSLTQGQDSFNQTGAVGSNHSNGQYSLKQTGAVGSNHSNGQDSLNQTGAVNCNNNSRLFGNDPQPAVVLNGTEDWDEEAREFDNHCDMTSKCKQQSDKVPASSHQESTKPWPQHCTANKEIQKHPSTHNNQPSTQSVQPSHKPLEASQKLQHSQQKHEQSKDISNKVVSQKQEVSAQKQQMPQSSQPPATAQNQQSRWSDGKH